MLLVQLVVEVMATGSAGNIHCCLCEAVVDANEHRSVATTIIIIIIIIIVGIHTRKKVQITT